MNDRKRFCNDILELINGKISEITFFVGAGISSNPPSSLPLAKDVKLALLESLCKSTPKTCIDQFYDKNKKEIEGLLENILMESIFEIIMRRMPNNGKFVTQMIKEVFNGKNPNNNHVFLARLIKTGCYVITTNFDMLIEEAVKRDPACNFNQLRHKIMHVHGSIDDQESIIITLSQVGQGLTKNIEDKLKNALKNKIVIFIGWSDKDIDITPILFLSEMSQIYWLQHDQNFDDGMILHYNDDEIKDSKDDPINKLIKKFKGTKYIGKTDKVIDEIWQGFDKPAKQPEYSEETNSKWKEPIKRLEDLEEWARVLIFLEVVDRIDSKKKLPLELIGRLEKTFEKTFPSKKFSEFLEIERYAFYELCCKKSVCYRIIEKYNDAIESAEQGLKLIKTPDDFSWFIELQNDIASAHNDRGSFLRERGNCEEAIKEHEEAVKIFEENIKKLDDKLGELRSLTNEEKWLLDKAQVHTNLGSTYCELYHTCSQCQKSPYFPNELLNKAEENYRKGIEIHEKIHEKLKLSSDGQKNYNLRKLGDLYNNIANVYFQKSEKEKAETYYEKGRKILTECGYVRGKKRLLKDYSKNFPKNEIYLQISTELEALEVAFVEALPSCFQIHLLFKKF